MLVSSGQKLFSDVSVVLLTGRPMRTKILFTFIIILTLFAPVFGQQPKPSPQVGTQSKDEVVRVTTNLVQVDVVVTEKDGKQVSDLHPEEFEVLEDGRKQQITNFSYVSTSAGPSAQSATTLTRAGEKGAPKILPALLRPEDVRRTIALV